MLRIRAIRGGLLCSLAAALSAPAGAQLAPGTAGERQYRMEWSVPAATSTALDLVVRSAPPAPAGPSLAGGAPAAAAGNVAQLELRRPIVAAWSAIAQLGLRGADLHAAVGALRKFEGGGETGASLGYRQPAGGFAPVRELSAFAALRERDWRYQLSFNRSLDPASPDVGLALSVARRF